MKNATSFFRLTTLLFCTLLYWPMQAQVADGAPPSQAPGAKYIFYWGKQQCDLSEANAYNAGLEMSPEAFRQMILTAPRLWNGTTLVQRLTFKINELLVSSQDYLTQLAQIDAKIGPSIKVGNTVKITELSLAEGLWGAIDCRIGLQTEPTAVSYGNWSGHINSYLNENFVDRVTWGREDIYENSDRNFFTVNEFWQTIRQEPALEWRPFQKPLPLRCMIGFTTKEKASFDLVTPLEEGTYSNVLTNLENYRHMVHPGAIVALQLQTAGQYDQLYRKNMFIVADDDPRLRLRNKRDQHELEFHWGDIWTEKIPGLYLQRFTTPQGESILADPPITRSSGISFPPDRNLKWGTEKPTCRIDGELVTADVSFRVVLSDSMALRIHSNNYNADSISAIFTPNNLMLDKLKIDSIQVEGYELPPMTFTMMTAQLLVRNDFAILQQLAGNTTRAKLFPPIVSRSELAFQLELPEKSPATFSIFEPDGTKAMSQYDTFTTGTIVRVLRSQFKNKGRHIAFLNTIAGVAKVEFNVE